MKKVMLLVVLLYFVAFTNAKPISQSEDYQVKKKVINTPVNDFL
jgi:hypothetical protein